MFANEDNLSLDFYEEPTDRQSHRLHPYAAKFPPALAAWAVREFSGEHDIILDPMAGSGTSLVESCLANRTSIGVDIDPLARLLCRVKTTLLGAEEWNAAADAVLRNFRNRAANTRQLPNRYRSIGLPSFEGRDYWFTNDVCHGLKDLLAAIDETPCRVEVRRALYVVFSSMIISKGTSGVSNALDVSHSRPHWVQRPSPADVEATLVRRLKAVKQGLMSFAASDARGHATVPEGASAFNLPVRDSSVGLIVTSPPYINAIDYPRAHKFSVWWLAERLGVTANQYLAAASQYLGTDRVPPHRHLSRIGVDVIDEAIQQAASANRKRAAIAHKYFSDMLLVLAEMRRVLRNDARAVLVVAPGRINGTAFPTEEAVCGLAASPLVSSPGDGLYVEALLKREIDPGRRQLPYLRGKNAAGMKEEYVIVLARHSTDE